MWLNLRGHDAVAERFRRTLVRGRLASTYLFVGPSGIGKRSFALCLAKTLLCRQAPVGELAPCGQCESCALFVAGSHPDLLTVAKPADKSSLPIEQFIGKAEKRNQEGLCHDISLRPMVSGRRVAIIDDADYFNESSANCLLKTLEEPPPRSVIFLIGTSLSKQLPTIRSRAQVVRFAPLSAADVAEILRDKIPNPPPPSAGEGLGEGGHDIAIESLAQRCGGSVEAAIASQDDVLWQFRADLLKQLSELRLNGVKLAKHLNDFINEAGKDAPSRRARLRQIIAFAAELYRVVLHVNTAGTDCLETSDPSLRQATIRLVEQGFTVDCGYQALETCLAAEEHVGRNANQATLIQWWLIKLAKIHVSCGLNAPVAPV